MESPPHFFNGSVADAVSQASARNCTFLVFIYDDSEQSVQYEGVLADPEIASLIRLDTIGLRLHRDSQDAIMFGQLFPVGQVPSVYFIRSGTLRDVISGVINHDNLLARLRQSIDTPQVIAESLAQQAETASSPSPQPPLAAVPVLTTPASSSQSSLAVGGSSDSTEGERIAQRERLKNQIDENRKKREAEEKKKLRQEELNRRNQGKNQQNLQKTLREKEAKRIADELAKDRKEAEEAKRRIREQIARDKEERAAQRQAEIEERRQVNASYREPGPSRPAQITYANISIRQLDGATLRNRFEAKNTLFDVQTWIEENRLDGDMPYVLVQTYPNRTFTAGDEAKTLAELELSPSATLIMRRVKKVVSGPMEDGYGAWTVLSAGMSAVSGVLGRLASMASDAYEYVTMSGAPEATDRQTVRDENGEGQIGSNSDDDPPPSQKDDKKLLNRRPYGANIATLSSSSNERSDREPRSTYNGNSTNQM